MRSFYCFHSFLCARGVVRAQKLLGYVLISPEGSNDRFAYVIVVDISSLWHYQLPTVNCQLSIVNCQLSIVNGHWSTVNCQLSTANCQLPIVNCQLSLVNCQCPTESNIHFPTMDWCPNHRSIVVCRIWIDKSFRLSPFAFRL